MVIEFSRQDIILALMINAYDIVKQSPDLNFGLFDRVDNELIGIIAEKVKHIYNNQNKIAIYNSSLKSFNNDIVRFINCVFPDGTIVAPNKIPKNFVQVFYYSLKEKLTLDNPTTDAFFHEDIIDVFRRNVKKEFVELIKTEIIHPSRYKFFETMKVKYQRYAGTMDEDVLMHYYSDFEKNYLKFCNQYPERFGKYPKSYPKKEI